jgi:hypothetical protein
MAKIGAFNIGLLVAVLVLAIAGIAIISGSTGNAVFNTAPADNKASENVATANDIAQIRADIAKSTKELKELKYAGEPGKASAALGLSSIEPPLLIAAEDLSTAKMLEKNFKRMYGTTAAISSELYDSTKDYTKENRNVLIIEKPKPKPPEVGGPGEKIPGPGTIYVCGPFQHCGFIGHLGHCFAPIKPPPDCASRIVECASPSCPTPGPPKGGKLPKAPEKPKKAEGAIVVEKTDDGHDIVYATGEPWTLSFFAVNSELAAKTFGEAAAYGIETVEVVTIEDFGEVGFVGGYDSAGNWKDNNLVTYTGEWVWSDGTTSTVRITRLGYEDGIPSDRLPEIVGAARSCTEKGASFEDGTIGSCIREALNIALGPSGEAQKRWQ